MIALVAFVTRRSTDEGSSVYVSGSMSAKAGRPPQKSTVEAVAKNVRGGIITSEPFDMPMTRFDMWSADVPEDVAIACFLPM